ncbi:MAG: protein kinase [Candidatus Eremiobacteraeota bacterium]|nr:protein kinase [Candidatus Eremiobacteraeota bacterium]
MISKLLPGTKLKNGRYQIVKIALWRRTGGTYEAWDITITDKRYIIKEVIPPTMSNHERRSRLRNFNETMDVMTHLEHTNLAKVFDHFEENDRIYTVIEFIDGVSLEHFLELIRKIPEKNAVEIGLTLCEAVRVLWNRPQPISFENIGTEYVMIDYDKRIRFMGYDFSRFYYDDFPHKTFARSPEAMEKSIHKLSKIIFALLGGSKEIPLERVPSDMKISPELRRLLMITLNPQQKSYSSIEKFRSELQEIYDPKKSGSRDEAVFLRHRRERKEKEIPTYDWIKRIPQTISSAIMGQSQWLKVLEALFVLFLIFIFIIFKNPAGAFYRKPPDVSMVYVCCQSDLYTFRDSDFKFMDQRKLGNELSSIYAYRDDNSQFLLLADYKQGKVLRIDPHNNKVIEEVNVDIYPHKMGGTPDGKLLFILHENINNISFINCETLRLTGFLPAGLSASDMIYLAGKNSLLVSNTLPQDLLWIDATRRKVMKRHKIAGQPGIMITSPPGDKLYVHDKSTGDILVFDIVKDIKQLGVLDDVGGEVPSSFLWDVKPGRLWITFRKTNNIVLYDIEKQEVLKNYKVDKQPIKVIWNKNFNRLWIINEKSKTINVIHPDSGKILMRHEMDKTPSDIMLSP